MFCLIFVWTLWYIVLGFIFLMNGNVNIIYWKINILIFCNKYLYGHIWSIWDINVRDITPSISPTYFEKKSKDPEHTCQPHTHGFGVVVLQSMWCGPLWMTDCFMSIQLCRCHCSAAAFWLWTARLIRVKQSATETADWVCCSHAGRTFVHS